VLHLKDIPLAGEHNVENALAAVAAARLAGAQPEAIARGIRSFAGVEHRLEFVAEIGGVRYYNDSKATNVDATLKALDAFPGRILIVLGGKDKGSDYTVLQKPLREKAILALLIGAAAEKIEKEIGNGQRQLSNEQFLAKAPTHVVEGIRKRAGELEVLRGKSRSKLDELGCE